MPWKKSKLPTLTTDRLLTLSIKLESSPPSPTPTSLHSKMSTMTKPQEHCFSSLNSQKAVISPLSLKLIKSASSTSLKVRYGAWLSKFSTHWKLYIKWTSSTEISKVPIYSSLSTINKSNWEIWMSARLAKVAWLLLKLAHPTMRVHRFGLIFHIMANAISGLWDVFSTKWRLSDHLSLQLTSKLWRKESVQVYLIAYHHFTLNSFKIYLDCAL